MRLLFAALVPLGATLLCGLTTRAVAPEADKARYFAIEVVDEATGRGVPLVELETVNNLKFVTDSAGFVAFFEPGLMNRKVFFAIKSHGYEFEKDFLGFRGRQLEVVPGGHAKLTIKRLNVAERMYRVTGGGIYADSVLLGRPTPIREPILNGDILGMDSVQPTVYRDRIWWFWGDTNRPSYPLGNFHTTGATSALPGKGGLDPAQGIDFEFFTGPEGFARKMVPMPEGTEGPVWTDAVCVVPDRDGTPRLVGNFIRVKTLGTNLERGSLLFNDEKGVFEKVTDIPLDEPLGPHGQTVTPQIDVNGRLYQYFGVWGPPNIRVPATLKAFHDLSQYEAYTPLAAGARFAGTDTRLDRDASGKLIWGWKKNTATLSNREQRELIDAGRMKAEESPHLLVNVEDGKPVHLHSASVAYNAYRKKWVMIGLEYDGSSKLGEVWYAEAPAPEGPWKKGRKIVTHDKYSFYNPRQHDFLAGDGGRYVFFEGTFSNTLGGGTPPVPRYEYNQVMYRLDLADERLKAAQTD